MKKIKILNLLICISLLCCGCNKINLSNKDKNNIQNDKNEEEEVVVAYSGPNGTADTIDGKTIIISIYLYT